MAGIRTGWTARARLGLTRLGLGGIALAALVVGTAGSATAAGSTHPASGPGPVAATDSGPVRGLSAGGTDEFLGIPYAAPPVGDLRWRAPQPAARWQGVRDATAFAPHCAQSASPFGQASTSEDCLYLNVFTPARGHAPLPVMVWIHGGALVTGESNDYDPTKLVADGTVVVTINYRLGALGFLAHPALAGADGAAGDYGLMDQQAALRWVQRNIGHFGGDARAVTIFGESAGGLSVASQLASPAAHGLFDRAVIQSGAYALNTQSLATAEAAGETFATQVGCPDGSDTAACLRAVPVTTVLADQNATGYTPDVDGRVLTQSLKAAFTAGTFNRVPIVDGSNADEWRLFVALNTLQGVPVTAANYEATIEATLGVPAPVAAVIETLYPLSAYPSPSVAMGAVGTDAIFACPALALDTAVSAYVPTYAYEFNDENAPELFLPPVGFPYGAAHASEIQYVFDLAVAAFPTPLTSDQQQLASSMRAYWTNVARDGSPSSFGQPFWPRFTAVTPNIQSLVPPRPQVETDFAVAHRCAFWSLGG
jgi:para-nitrobenzyl esterase